MILDLRDSRKNEMMLKVYFDCDFSLIEDSHGIWEPEAEKTSNGIRRKKSINRLLTATGWLKPGCVIFS
jgi:hypothetical protein